MLPRQLPPIALFFGTAFFTGCTTPAPTPPAEVKPAVQAAPAPETVLPPGTVIERTDTFVSPTGKTYKVESVRDDFEEAERGPGVGLAAAPGDNFRGTSRKAAKLSIASAPMESFTDVNDLIVTLPAHSVMANHTPPIKTTAASNRVAEEKRNVKLTAFLYAASREDDNDFHLIVGRAPGTTPPVYFTVELSGLPSTGSAALPKLKAARTAFKTFFGSRIPGSSYSFYNPPIPVEIEGSLFFDMSHATGSRPGPQSLRPKMPVVWEVHPITKIVFEP